MRYYKYMYCSEGIHKRRVIRSIENGKLQRKAYLITLSEHQENQLDIINANYFLQPEYPQKDCFVVGIAENHGKALELVEKISQEVYDSTKGLDIRSYILNKEQEG